MDIYLKRQLFILYTTLLYSTCVGFTMVLVDLITVAAMATKENVEYHKFWALVTDGSAGLLGSIVLSIVFQMCGRKPVHLAINLLLFIGWIVYQFTESMLELYIARVFHSFTNVGIFMNSIIISEYVSPKRRGYFICLQKTFTAIGMFFCQFMLSFTGWKPATLMAALFSFPAIIMTWYWSESPPYLALKGQYKECEKSFKRLNGESSESDQLLKALLDSQRAKKELNTNKNSIVVVYLKRLFVKDFLKPLGIVSALILAVDVSTRFNLVLIEEEKSAACFGVSVATLRTLALVTSCFLITRFNRRRLLFLSGILTSALMYSICLVLYLKSVYEFSVLLWVTYALIIIQSFAVNIGLVPISFTLIGELFRLEDRALGACCSGLVYMIVYILYTKVSPLLYTSLTLHRIFAVNGAVLLICLLFVYRVLPETKDKTLQEIENDIKCKRVRRPVVEC